jgi:tRNA-specific 2-thiouridylase
MTKTVIAPVRRTTRTRATARELGIVLHRVSFALVSAAGVCQLWRNIGGRTPNPDVLCNREIKFGICQHYAQRLGAEWFATGHYARLAHGESGPQLLRGIDDAKDQSYFLCGVERSRFTRVLFPIGGMTKSEVRAAARQAGLAVFDKADSTGICFIGERPFTEFLARYLPESPGPIESTTGQMLGTHRGLPFTLGQRGGLRLAARGEAVTLVRGAQGSRAQRSDRGCRAIGRRRLAQGARTGRNWLIETPKQSFTAGIKVRYRQPDQSASVSNLPDGGAQIRFESPQWAVTPGQTAAFICKDRCLGGGASKNPYYNSGFANRQTGSHVEPGMTDSFKARSTLQLAGVNYQIYNIVALGAERVARLPYALKIPVKSAAL